jgi:MFS family permease
MGPPAGLAARHRLPPVRPAEPAGGLHYGWWIVLSAVLSIFVCLGIGRFALGMLLPAMGRALALDYVQMGWIGTANFIGYLLGALWVRRLLPRHGERRLIAMSLMLIVATMVGVALAGNFVPILILYGCTGLGSGIAMVSSMALVPHWFARKWRGLAVGFLSVGMGLGIILAGWAVPIANAGMGVMGWRIGWGGLAVLCLPMVLFCLIMIRNRPLDKGLEPFGEVSVDDENWVAPIGMARMEAGAGPRLRKAVLRLGAVYFLFGATYVVYGTFIVTTLVSEHGMAEAEVGRFWIWLGVFSLFCGPLLGFFSDRQGRRAGLCLSLFLQAGAYALIALGSGAMAVYFSIALFGLSAFAVPLIMTAAVADYSSPLRAAGIIGTITAIFGVGQILGPILAGVVADYSGSFTPAYLASASLVALAIAITLTLPDPPS